MNGIMMRTFMIGDRKLMRKTFGLFIGSKTESSCVVRPVTKQAEINRLERIQKHFKSKIERIEHINYHKVEGI